MQYVQIKIHGAVATVLLDHADRRNALSPRMIADISQAFSDLHLENRVRSVIVMGAGEHFCAGMDLSTLDAIAKMPEAEAHSERFDAWQNYAELLEQILRFPKPVVAAIDGAAVGAGLGLALSCDLMLMSDRATLSAEAIRRGLVGGATGALLAFRFGAATASMMMLTGNAIDAEEAFRRGMCTKVVASEHIWIAASELANKCAEAPRMAVQATKRLLNESVGEAMLSQLAAGTADSATASSTEAAREGVSAFLEKREPNWP